VGENEMNDNAVSVRKRGGVDLGTMSADAFMEQALDEVKTKKIQ
jgi:threonyl-tRNA synthetase